MLIKIEWEPPVITDHINGYTILVEHTAGVVERLDDNPGKGKDKGKGKGKKKPKNSPRGKKPGEKTFPGDHSLWDLDPLQVDETVKSRKTLVNLPVDGVYAVRVCAKTVKGPADCIVKLSQEVWEDAPTDEQRWAVLYDWTLGGFFEIEFPA